MLAIKDFYTPKDKFISSGKGLRSGRILACLIDSEQAIKSLFTAVLLHVEVNAFGRKLQSLINVDASRQVVGLAVWKTCILGGTDDALVKSFFSSILTPLLVLNEILRKMR